MTDDRLSFDELADQDAFQRRHIGPSAPNMAEMLAVVGAKDMETLIAETVPGAIRSAAPLETGAPMTEEQALAHLRSVASENKVMTSLIGQGYYGTHLPPVIQRNLLENPAWYTAYTPYQPEISQGRLEALLNFQTMICDLTGLEIANASLLDEATAAAEAMAMAERVSKSKANAFFVDRDAHPQSIAVIRTRAEPLGWEVIVGDPMTDLNPSAVFGALFQYPGSSGAIRDYSAQIAALHDSKALAVMAADLLALTLLTPPGEMGADIAIGSAQRFGVPMGYGGPHAAYMATQEKHKRALPGRLVGVSVDAAGRPAYRLALQTREQHIRREKATSNICTAQVLLAVIASMYAVWHGPDRLTRIAQRVRRLTATLAEGLKGAGLTIAPEAVFDTLTIETGEQTEAVHRRALGYGINLRRIDGDSVGVSLDETSTPELIDKLFHVFGADASFVDFEPEIDDTYSGTLARTSGFLTHPVFHLYRSETEMMRYLRRLSDKDLALDRAMIPLGSCTMKLNAAAEMIPISWPEFGALHPFAPADQAQGYAQMLEDLSRQLCEITGYDEISMQPNSGAQGEYAGLLAIRGYHLSRGDAGRNVCLIPSSAHGTNPASAQMAGMKVVVVACDAEGNVDVADLTAKAEKHSEALAACMITYPSTHGVFEEAVREVCDIVHRHGGQVYLDGANLNAQVGLAAPGAYGADVSHLNLHKTFCIPHGGGGPGMGPIGVRAHLAPFLPGHPVTDPDAPVGPVSAAPYGSASILPISWAYCLMMGADGLTRATGAAILNANYIAARLEGAYDVLYRGPKGRVAHECILDTRPFKEAGVSVDDIAKRLIDYSFHAPTMSFPVAGTLMVEPTESESRAEIDRFCDAMLAIREETAKVEAGEWSPTDNPLAGAPHTAEDLAGPWERAYSREVAAFPVKGLRRDKYWAPVGRVDNVFGDRNLICACPPMESYAEAAE